MPKLVYNSVKFGLRKQVDFLIYIVDFSPVTLQTVPTMRDSQAASLDCSSVNSKRQAAYDYIATFSNQPGKVLRVESRPQ
jgi:hypothetical protein